MRFAALLLGGTLAVVSVGLLPGCDEDEGPADTGSDGDGDVDADADLAVDGDFPPLDCGDDPDNWNQCMLSWPDGGPENGAWCDGQCRPLCGPSAGGVECPGSLVCHRAGAVGVCFEP
jgi:hypothetical protein